MTGGDYYIPAAALWISLAFKLPALRHNWRDPLLRSVCSLLILSGAVFVFAAPPTISVVNRLTGTPNFSAPLVYALISAFSASCLILIVNWRGGPPEDTRRFSRRWTTFYGVVIVAVVVLFVLGETPVERLRDFDTYYANTPYIREMIALYLVTHHIAAVVMTVLCWRWSLQVRGWLRTGLVIIVVGYGFTIAYDMTKFAAVGARWAGRDWDGLSTYLAPPLASMGALVSAIGFILPLMCQRAADNWHTWATYRQLGALWRELRGAVPAGTPSVRIAWWSPAELRVLQRESDIHDGFLTLGPYFDLALHARVYERSLAAGEGPDGAKAVADAAMVAAAVRARSAAAEEPDGPDGPGALDDGPDGDETPVRVPGPAEGPRDLVRISHALRHSREVAAARRATGTG
ncbi:MAB_1171c family putative transporter [Streptomyces sp. NPDC101118]|uniref:MAB_1171c family putative transporter n=1 Tax=Streptomyces sp. NPDC101118 TaxID=3366109 RepID=UPI003824A529